MRNIRSKVDKANASMSSVDNAVYNDAEMFLKQLQRGNCFVGFKMDEEKHLSIALLGLMKSRC